MSVADQQQAQRLAERTLKARERAAVREARVALITDPQSSPVLRQLARDALTGRDVADLADSDYQRLTTEELRTLQAISMKLLCKTDRVIDVTAATRTATATTAPVPDEVWARIDIVYKLAAVGLQIVEHAERTGRIGPYPEQDDPANAAAGAGEIADPVVEPVLPKPATIHIAAEPRAAFDWSGGFGTWDRDLGRLR